MKSVLLFISLFLAPACCVTALLERDYDFHRTLDSSGKYELYWSFDLEYENISFAVRVQTTGWIGFGLSPNGQMPNSDVVIGWVDESGKGYLQDRFADDRAIPPVDAKQDWALTGAEEENGYTTLEFARKLLTCDDRDLEIKADTARIIWSYFPTDPEDSRGPVSQHDKQGTRSINLLTETVQDSTPPSSDYQSFRIQVENLLVPNETDTTYWCVSANFSTALNERIYIYKFGPYIPEHAAAYVHHMIAYLCPLGHSLPSDLSTNCFDIGVDDVLNPCLSNEAIGVWAVGGEDFAFPEGVAFAVEGDDTNRFVLLEMHYDNPDLVGDVYDNSGLDFYYTTTPPKQEAGMLFVGSSVTPTMFIPPNADNFAIKSICSADCLGQYLPENGIRLFANFLHTHLLGYGLTVHHFTTNNECGATEELQPADQNLKYDFDYQQFAHLPNEVIVKPGDSLELTCNYRSSGTNRTGVTLGGLGTREEMCVTFFYYYPRTNLSGCSTAPDPVLAYRDFVTSNIEDSTQAELLFEAIQNYDSYNISKVLNTVSWDGDTVQQLQDALLAAPHWLTCFPHNVENITLESLLQYTQPVSFHDPDCLYEAPDRCTGSMPLPCCERLRQEQPLSPSSSPTPDGAGTLVISVTTMLMLFGTAIISVF